MVWLIPIPPILILAALIALMFIGVLLIQFWPITLALAAILVAAAISRRMARRERVEAARKLGGPLMLACLLALAACGGHSMAECKGPLFPLNAGNWQPTAEDLRHE